MVVVVVVVGGGGGGGGGGGDVVELLVGWRLLVAEGDPQNSLTKNGISSY